MVLQEPTSQATEGEVDMVGMDQKELGPQEEGLPGRNQSYGRDAARNAMKIRRRRGRGRRRRKEKEKKTTPLLSSHPVTLILLPIG